jgi:hypothetical protein
MFLFDQNLRQTTAVYLRDLGFDTVSTRDLDLEYASDEVLHPILKRLLSFVSVESLAGALTLVDNRKIRIRRAGQATYHILLNSN